MKKNYFSAHRNKLINFAVFFLFIFIVSLFFHNEISGMFSYVKGNGGAENIYINFYDSLSQHVIFHKEYFRLLDTGEALNWDWNIFLGSNFFVTKAYYLSGDIFTYFEYFVYKLFNSVEFAIFMIMLLKVAISGFGFYLILRKCKLNLFISILFGMLYAFSGWQCTYAEQIMFTSFYCILPYFILSFEYILQDDKYLGLIISTIIMVGINFYLFWPACILALIYWIVRYNLIRGKLFDKIGRAHV